MIEVLHGAEAGARLGDAPVAEPEGECQGAAHRTGDGPDAPLERLPRRGGGRHGQPEDRLAGAIDKYTIVYQGGIVVNPRRVQRNAENGATQGMSEVLKEEVSIPTRARSRALTWVGYPIMRMVDMPKINAVILQRMDLAYFGPGSEGFSSGPYISIPAAFFDATGKPTRTLPLRPGSTSTPSSATNSTAADSEAEPNGSAPQSDLKSSRLKVLGIAQSSRVSIDFGRYRWI